jgi:hypothetical protein
VFDVGADDLRLRALGGGATVMKIAMPAAMVAAAATMTEFVVMSFNIATERPRAE